MSSLDRVPVSRGFNSSLGYLSGAEDHYTNMRDGNVDLWRNTLPAYGLNNTDYATYLYTKEVMRILNRYHAAKQLQLQGHHIDDVGSQENETNDLSPLFIYMAYQSTHGPLQVPKNWTDIYPNISYEPRKKCQGMISAVDASIGLITQALKDYGLFNDALIIFSSDNGGPHDHANNYPLRASKGSDFQGGVKGL